VSLCPFTCLPVMSIFFPFANIKIKLFTPERGCSFHIHVRIRLPSSGGRAVGSFAFQCCRFADERPIPTPRVTEVLYGDLRVYTCDNNHQPVHFHCRVSVAVVVGRSVGRSVRTTSQGTPLARLHHITSGIDRYGKYYSLNEWGLL
jgi:hypothetical protein